MSDDLKFDMKKAKFIKQLNKRDYRDALSTLKILKGFNRSLPSVVLYYEGLALYKTKNYSKAYEVLLKYVKNGRSGERYEDALNLLDDADEAKMKESTQKKLDKTIFTFKGLKYNIITSPYTGKKWLDRNIGAKSQCTDTIDDYCFGGHYSWNDAKNICPSGFRLPTKEELSQLIKNHVFSSELHERGYSFKDHFLKLPYSGFIEDGKLWFDYGFGNFWSSKAIGENAWSLGVSVYDRMKMEESHRSNGYSVRCIKN